MKSLEECSFPADWKAIKAIGLADPSEETWATIFESVLMTRLNSRYFDPIGAIEGQPGVRGMGEGFLILTVLCSLLEFLAALKKGWNFRHGHSENGKDALYGYSDDLFIDFLRKEPPFSEHFTKRQAKAFYIDIRCGLIHEAQTRRQWRVWRGFETAPLIDHRQKVVYRDRMTVLIKRYLAIYGEELCANAELQQAFVRKFDFLFDNATDEVAEP